MTEAQWRQGNWAASVVITGAALLCLALVQPWGRRLPRPVLLGVARVGAVFAVLHWVAYTAAPLLNFTGITGGEVTSFDRWNLLVFEPWFLGMGVLLAVAAAQNARRHKASAVSGAVAAPRRPSEVASAALIYGGAFVVLLGVMSFHFLTFAVIGPALLGTGVLVRIRTRGGRRNQA